jgi:hypothetical protein
MQGWRVALIVVVVLVIFGLVAYVGVTFMSVTDGR